MCMSRVTVSVEIFRTSAVSSTFSPPKIRSSTTWLLRASKAAKASRAWYLYATLDGATYAVQDLPFHDCFTRAGPPSTSLNGWYSMTNAFSAPAAICQ